MLTNSRTALAVMALFAATGCSGAQAAIVHVTYTGIVTDGYDTTGVFGAANTYLNGAEFSVNYLFDTSLGHSYSDANSNQVHGGPYVGAGVATPSLGASIAINAVTMSVSGDYYGYIRGYNDGSFSTVRHQAQDYFNDGVTISDHDTIFSYIYNNGSALPSDIEAPFSYSVAAGDTSGGYAEFLTYDYGLGVHTERAYAYLLYQTFTIRSGSTDDPGVVPEPGTASLLGAGLFGLGAAARRKKFMTRTGKG